MLADKDGCCGGGYPDHWHCLQMIDACAAGKDVFCEKPVSNSIYEAQLMESCAALWQGSAGGAMAAQPAADPKDAVGTATFR